MIPGKDSPRLRQQPALCDVRPRDNPRSIGRTDWTPHKQYGHTNIIQVSRLSGRIAKASLACPCVLATNLIRHRTITRMLSVILGACTREGASLLRHRASRTHDLRLGFARSNPQQLCCRQHNGDRAPTPLLTSYLTGMTSGAAEWPFRCITLFGGQGTAFRGRCLFRAAAARTIRHLGPSRSSRVRCTGTGSTPIGAFQCSFRGLRQREICSWLDAPTDQEQRRRIFCGRSLTITIARPVGSHPGVATGPPALRCIARPREGSTAVSDSRKRSACFPSANPAQSTSPVDQRENTARRKLVQSIPRSRAVPPSMPLATFSGPPPTGVVADGSLNMPCGSSATSGRTAAKPTIAQPKRLVGLLLTGGTIDLTTTTIQSA